MNEKINVLGVNIDSFTAKEAMKETIAFLESEPVSVIDVVSVDALMQMNDLPELKEKMNEFDMILPGEKLILEKMQEHDGCLGFVDMDNLKKINDVYGHKAGDRALRLVGDEFLFYLSEASEEEMNMRMRKLFESFGAAKNLTTETSPASLSCGLCMCRQGGSFEEYYIRADKALYYVKQNGKNSYRFYEELEEQQTDA